MWMHFSSHRWIFHNKSEGRREKRIRNVPGQTNNAFSRLFIFLKQTTTCLNYCFLWARRNNTVRQGCLQYILFVSCPALGIPGRTRHRMNRLIVPSDWRKPPPVDFYFKRKNHIDDGRVDSLTGFSPLMWSLCLNLFYSWVFKFHLSAWKGISWRQRVNNRCVSMNGQKSPLFHAFKSNPGENVSRRMFVQFFYTSFHNSLATHPNFRLQIFSSPRLRTSWLLRELAFLSSSFDATLWNQDILELSWWQSLESRKPECIEVSLWR